jgi:subtilisin family serine protease
MNQPKYMLRTLAAASLMTAFAAGSSLAAPPDSVRLIVAYKPGAAHAAERAVAAAGGQLKLRIFGTDAIAVEVPRPAVEGLSRNPQVEYVEEDVTRSLQGGPTGKGATVQGAFSAEQSPYGIAMVQANHADFTSAAVVSQTYNRMICIIDSGYDGRHEDLKHDTTVGGEYDSGTGNWDTDENHHGTHVAGTIAGVDNSVGVIGVVPGVRLHIVKVFGKDGWAYSSTLVNAAKKCQAAGANVISMSLGGTFSSRTESSTFDSLLKAGILSIAAAGNDGNTRTSYPAGYASVMSVAAIDSAAQWASFSQYNKDVEIAAPGVAVLSTVPMGAGSESSLSVGATTYAPGGMDGSPKTSAAWPLADFGLGDVVTAGSMANKICLIARGTIEFGLKVKNCQDSGGKGAVIYNNVAGGFGGTVGTYVTTIPSVTASDTEGLAMKQQLGQTATVKVDPANYAYYDGTSMATPHVSAVAALVWSFKTTCSAAQVRNVLTSTAMDKGAAGRDTKYGFGLVQAKAAKDKLLTGNCGA